jgi:NADPH oxidase 1
VTKSSARLKSGSGKVHLRRLDVIWVCRNINQLQWFANLLVTIQNDMATLNPDFFHVMIYLTRTEDKEQVPLALRASTTFGRPNWDGVISRVRQQLEAGGYAEGVDKVGVFLCGSAALGKDLAKTCRLYSHGKYSFPFKKEHF